MSPYTPKSEVILYCLYSLDTGDFVCTSLTFSTFSPISNDFINIHEYANDLIIIYVHSMIKFFKWYHWNKNNVSQWWFLHFVQFKNVQEGNDQEMAQSEKDSHSKNRSGKN